MYFHHEHQFLTGQQSDTFVQEDEHQTTGLQDLLSVTTV
jgi:hypothetical protein